MSQTTGRQTIPYGDRPIANVKDGGGVYATYDFLQFLTRLSRGFGTTVENVTQVYTTTTNNSASITSLQTQINQLLTSISALQATAQDLQQQINNTQVAVAAVPPQSPSRPPLPISPPPIALGPLAPRPTLGVQLAAGAAVALTSGTPANVVSANPGAGTWVALGTVYLTGAAAAAVTRGAGSINTTSATLATAPGQFATGYYAGVAFSTIGQDISLGAMAAVLQLGASATVYLIAQATFSSTMSAYGNLIIRPA